MPAAQWCWIAFAFATAIILSSGSLASNLTADCPEIQVNDSTSHYDLMSQLTNPCRYDKNIRPVNPGDEALRITSKIHIYFLQSVQSSILQFKVHMLLQLRWHDHRLSYRDISNFTELHGEKPMLSMIWFPHMFFINERESAVMGASYSDELISVLPDGEILLSRRMKTAIVCRMEQGKFPFDEQTCNIVMDSWRYNISNVVFQWEETIPVSIGHPGLTEFTLFNITTDTKQDDSKRPNVWEIRDVQTYSSLIVTLYLAREYGFYFMDYYVPSVLIVILSWLTFWIEPDVVPARVWIATCTMLTFFALGAMNDATPQLTKFKTNDIWFIGCTLFIFLSLAEFAFVNIVHRQETKRVQLKKASSKYVLMESLKIEPKPWKKKSSSCPSSPELRRRMKKLVADKKKQEREQKAINAFDLAIPLAELARNESRRRKTQITETPQEPTHMTNQQLATFIDRRSRVVFPLLFVVFNGVYWSIMFT